MLGTHVVLRDERRDSDSEDLFHWLNLEEWQYYDEPDRPFEGISREAFDKQREESQRRPRKTPSNSHRWQVDTAEGQHHIGWVNYYQMDEQAQRAYVGICLPEEAVWGKGYGTEAMRLLVEHLFDEMALEEVRTATWTGNKRMIRCAEKSGFKELARMPHRAEHSMRGEPLERIEFSISRAEWLTRRGSD